jgi:hypothetical protein
LKQFDVKFDHKFDHVFIIYHLMKRLVKFLVFFITKTQKWTKIITQVIYIYIVCNIIIYVYRIHAVHTYHLLYYITNIVKPHIITEMIEIIQSCYVFLL